LPGSKGQNTLCLHEKHFEFETCPNIEKGTGSSTEKTSAEEPVFAL
jgi:hypothetical protein